MFILIVGLSMTSCDKIFKQNVTQEKNRQVVFQERVGGEEDEHGCITAAGFTWSNLQQDCVKLFEVAYRLNPVSDLTNDDHVDAAIISAFVIFADDESKIELFLPQAEEGLVIEKDADGNYKKDVYLFDKESFVLYENKEKTFQAAEYELKNITQVGE